MLDLLSVFCIFTMCFYLFLAPNLLGFWHFSVSVFLSSPPEPKLLFPLNAVAPALCGTGEKIPDIPYQCWSRPSLSRCPSLSSPMRDVYVESCTHADTRKVS